MFSRSYTSSAMSVASKVATIVLLLLTTSNWFVCCSFAVTSSSIPPDDPTQCPTWFVSNSSGTGCRCGTVGVGVKCDESSNQVCLLVGKCMTFDAQTKVTFVGDCPFSAPQESDNDCIVVPQNVTELNSFMCGGFNRAGVLCSHCEPGLGTPLLSYDWKCTECLGAVRGWLLYVFLACVPATILLFSLFLLRVRATSAPMNCFIFWAQFSYVIMQLFKQSLHDLSTPLDTYAKILATFYGFSTLDFFQFFTPSFCASSDTTILHALALQYVAAVYPLVLVVVVYVCVQKYAMGSRVLACLWVPFKLCFARMQRVWDPSQSLVHSFATFLVMAYFKVMIVSFLLLFFIELKNNVKAPSSKRAFLDASLPYFGRGHALLGVLAILMSAIFNLSLMLLLFLYPTRAFQSCLNCCKVRSHALHVFADAFNGCYKNGCGGSRDHRWFAGYYLFLRIAFFIVAQPLGWRALGFTILVIVTVFLLLLLRPYKDDFFNYLDASLFVCMSLAIIVCLFIDMLGGSIRIIIVFVLAIPSFYFSLYLIAKVIVYTEVLDRHQCCQGLNRLLQRVTADFGAPSLQYENTSRQASGENPHYCADPGPVGDNFSTRYGAV